MREFHSRHRYGVTETHGNLRWAVESGGCPHAAGFLHVGPIVQRLPTRCKHQRVVLQRQTGSLTFTDRQSSHVRFQSGEKRAKCSGLECGNADGSVPAAE